ncbi:Lachrymatory-factor synthase [Acorus calamus]|uniref:Lachrymatory-factor synthase n=1 Tax=Acorus calamus TaxID=4465 RepID=A0AAV9CLZ4_ACOCL|nr:Lachrymatory-factor synthase [Acorus calamus]
MEQKPKLEWEGKTTATLTNTTADQAWSLMKNFTDVDKILPAVHKCSLHREAIRWKASTVSPAASGTSPQGWTKEEFDGFLGRGMEDLARRIEEFKG